MWTGILLIVVATGVLAAIWMLKTKKRDAEKVTYACTYCGEMHCDCHRDHENS